MHPINHPNVIHVSNPPVETPEGGIGILSCANFSQGICINKVSWRVLFEENNSHLHVGPSIGSATWPSDITPISKPLLPVKWV